MAGLIHWVLNLPENKDYLKKILLNKFLWLATELNEEGKKNKYLGQKYWSEEAIRQFNKRSKNPNLKGDRKKGLIHDHSIPRKEIINDLIGSNASKVNKKSARAIYELLLKKSIAAVITKKEHERLAKKNLSATSPGRGKFARYKKAKIKIFRVHREFGDELKKIKQVV